MTRNDKCHKRELPELYVNVINLGVNIYRIFDKDILARCGLVQAESPGATRGHTSGTGGYSEREHGRLQLRPGVG